VDASEGEVVCMGAFSAFPAGLQDAWERIARLPGVGHFSRTSGAPVSFARLIRWFSLAEPRLLRFAHPFGAAFGWLSPVGRLTTGSSHSPSGAQYNASEAKAASQQKWGREIGAVTASELRRRSP
jgi:hypothetical protein